MCGWQTRRGLDDACWYNLVARGFAACRPRVRRFWNGAWRCATRRRRSRCRNVPLEPERGACGRAAGRGSAASPAPGGWRASTAEPEAPMPGAHRPERGEFRDMPQRVPAERDGRRVAPSSPRPVDDTLPGDSPNAPGCDPRFAARRSPGSAGARSRQWSGGGRGAGGAGNPGPHGAGAAVRSGWAGRGAADRSGGRCGGRRPRGPSDGAAGSSAGRRFQDEPPSAGAGGRYAGAVSAADGISHRAVLRAIFPDRPVRCALVWTWSPGVWQCCRMRWPDAQPVG